MFSNFEPINWNLLRGLCKQAYFGKVWIRYVANESYLPAKYKIVIFWKTSLIRIWHPEQQSSETCLFFFDSASNCQIVKKKLFGDVNLGTCWFRYEYLLGDPYVLDCFPSLED